MFEYMANWYAGKKFSRYRKLFIDPTNNYTEIYYTDRA